MRRRTKVSAPLLLLSLASGLGVLAVARAEGIDLQFARTAAAVGALLPLTLAFAAVGAAVASFKPRGAVGLLSAVVVTSYLILFLGPLLKAPDWILKLSAFNLYGNPIASEINWLGLAALSLAGLAGFTIAGVAIQRRDVGS